MAKKPLHNLVNDETVMREIAASTTRWFNKRTRILRAKYALIVSIIFWLLTIAILLPWALKG